MTIKKCKHTHILIHILPKWWKTHYSFCLYANWLSLPRFKPKILLNSADAIEANVCQLTLRQKIMYFPTFWNKVGVVSIEHSVAVTRLDELLFEIRRSRRVSKSSSSRRVTRLVPVCILETDNRTIFKMFAEARPDE